MKKDFPYVYFGSPQFSADVLDQLEAAGLTPDLVVTAPDKKRGRGQKKKPTPVKRWAKNHNIETLTPESIDARFINTLKEESPRDGWPVFVVVAYGKILPSDIIYLPERNTLNLHPSLLPRVRGAAPIRGTILQEDEAGVTIIELDEKMDHGPVVAQQQVDTDRWPPRYDQLQEQLATVGGTLLAETLPKWVAGDIDAQPQNHDKASYIEKFSAADGEIDFSDSPEYNLRKIRAFTDWPKAHFFTDNGTRVIITAAHIDGNELVIDRVKPSGHTEVTYNEWKDSR